MTNRDLVVIGGSSGATAPLKEILGAIPPEFPAAIAIVLHIPANSTGILATVASAACALPVHHAEEGAELKRGHVYLGSPDRHLLVVDGRVRLGTGPRENLVRPAIDPLFRSAALFAGPRVVGVILSGMLNDGASGLAAIKSCGGVALVQAPQSATASDMPLAALEASPVDLSAAPSELAAALIRYVGEAPGAGRPAPTGLKLEVEIAAGGALNSRELAHVATPVTLTCPDCGGVLSEVNGERPLRFRCQVGHAYTSQSLLKEQEGQVDEAMRVALRIIEERADLVSRMGDDANRVGRHGMAEMYEERASEYRSYAESLRQAVLKRMEIYEKPTNGDNVVSAEVRGHDGSSDIESDERL